MKMKEIEKGEWKKIKYIEKKKNEKADNKKTDCNQSE